MFGIEPSEFLLVGIVALVVIGPKDLPRAMRVVGQWVGRARGMARHFRSGFDEMVRQAELEEMEKRWAAENARIMAEHPATETPAEEAHDADYARSLPSPETPIDDMPPPAHEAPPATAEPKAPARARKAAPVVDEAPAALDASDQPGLPFGAPSAPAPRRRKAKPASTDEA